MNAKYTPVQWTRSKILYDIVLALLVAVYILTYLRVAPMLLDHAQQIDGAILRARAFGTCAFLMLTVILCIGPMAILDRRSLPLLYNRRHFGVVTFFVALTHAFFIVNWYFNFSPIPRFEAVFVSNVSYTQILGFPIETAGVLALFSLAILAATSHDFWLKFLSPPVWKGLHYLLYPTYALIVLHIALGALQDTTHAVFPVIVGGSVVLVCALHAMAALKETVRSGQIAQRLDVAGEGPRHGVEKSANEGTREKTSQDFGDWHVVGELSQFVDGRARVARLQDGQRVAVFRDGATLSALSNACAHQNGPLGEGKISEGCVTCPWHGFQYRLSDGRSPEPFTEKVPTYELRLSGTTVLVNALANPPGTYVEPLSIPESAP
ncbi:MAG: Rieske 2Fe-2S domain-containing protein [Hyphomicrobiaceae bacterium]